MTTFAGQFGPYPFINSRGDALPGVEIRVYDIDETALVTLYTDREKSDELPNPIPIGVGNGEAGVDDTGNAIFYAEPGQYLMVVRSLGQERYRAPILIPADPADAVASAVTSVNARTGVVTGLAEAADLATHAADTTGIHGIADTAQLETVTGAAAKVATHEADTTNVHGIANTAQLETLAGAQAKVDVEATARAAADLLLVPLTQKGVASGVATLDGTGKIPVAQVPSVAISDYLGDVASQGAMLALTGQRGDWCTRSDLSASFILIADDASVLANWKALPTPADAVASVNGRAGAVSGLAEQTALDAEATARASAISTLTTTVAAKVPLSTVTAANQLIVSSGSGAVAPLDVAASTFVGRKASGGVTAMTVAEAKTLLAMTAADVSAVPLTAATAVSFTAGSGDVLHVSVQNGLNGPSLQVLSQTAGKAVGLLLVPEATAPESAVTSQILLYGKSGTDYNRVGLTNGNSGFFFDSTYNGAGAARALAIQMGGSVSNSITSQTAIKIWTDAAVDLIGSTNFTAGGRSGWCGNFATRVADLADTGSSRLVIDTRTTTPTSNTADSALIEFRRGGTSKWLFGLNTNGGGVDSFDMVAGSICGLSVLAAGGVKIRSDSTNANASLHITNTAASGHVWTVGELNGVGRLGFRDITASGAPILIEFDGTAKAIRFNDPCNLIVGTTTGMQVATAVGQKLGFHGATPVVQRASAAQAAVSTTAATQTTPWGYSTQAQADGAITLLNEVRAALVEKGLIKGAA